MRQKYIFGPVISRRLGRSLGIDLIPHKVCSLNCLYCECGPTTHLTIKRQEFVPTEEVISQLRQFLSRNKKPIDVITFSGSGEPTLHSHIGEIIHFLKKHYLYPVCVLTNGTLLDRKSVQRDLMAADIVIPSLDSATLRGFSRINRPHPKLDIKSIINGIASFNKRFKGKLYLEIFIVPGINDREDEIKALIKATKKIQPDIIQLNTLDRPGTESWIKPASKSKLQQIAGQLSTITKVEIISRKAFKDREDLKKKAIPRSIRGRIVNILRRRPCTLSELSLILGLDKKEIKREIQEMKIIQQKKVGSGIFLTLKPALSD